MKRTYQKKSEYWTRIKPRSPHLDIPAFTPIQASAPIAPPTPIPSSQSFAEFAGGEHYTESVAACGGVSSHTQTMDNWSPVINANNLYPNLRAGIMPFSAEGGYWTMQIPITLATLAYFNIPLVRNTINLLQDFSISNLKITTENKTVEAFFTKWFESILLPGFMSQWFLEYYRSGNIFIYKFNGKIAPDKFAKMKTAFAAAVSPELPIRYIILDPKQVYLQVGPNFKGTYSRMLSTFEIERLRNPKTPEDKQMLKDFPPETQRQIMQYAAQPWLYVPLDTSRLYYNFYRKQDYEPLAVPMIFPLLNRLEYKLMLERMDMSLVQTMEQVFLMVTAGRAADERNPATDPKALQNLSNIFKTQTLGRVLVADYTTDAEWKIPDLKELLGKGKYEQVDKDIREGLGYQFFGDEKFANAMIKAKMFIESLKEGRRVFLDEFLRPEVKRICANLGFKHVPKIEFEEIDAQDQSVLQRVYLQMAQLGLLTPDELNQAIQNGLLPDKAASIKNQEEYAKLREKGLYQPLAPEKQGDEQGRPAGGGGAKSPSKKISPIGTKGSYHFNVKKLADTVFAMHSLEGEFEKVYKKHYALKKLNDAQKMFVHAATKAIVVNEEDAGWKDHIKAYIDDPKSIPVETLTELSAISSEFSTPEQAIDAWTAIALYKSRKDVDQKE